MRINFIDVYNSRFFSSIKDRQESRETDLKNSYHIMPAMSNNYTIVEKVHQILAKEKNEA